MVLCGVGVLACANWALNARGSSPPVPAVVAGGEDTCRLPRSSASADESSNIGSHALGLVAAAVKQAKINDERCGVPENAARHCRALAVAMLADPAAHLDDPARLEISIELTTWAAAEGAASAAGPEIAGSWEELADLISLLGREDQGILQAEFLRRRDVEEIVVPLRGAEAQCSGRAGREMGTRTGN